MNRTLIINIIFIIIAIIITTLLLAVIGITLYAIPISIYFLIPVLIYYVILKISLPFWGSIITKINLILSGIALIGFPAVFIMGLKFKFHGMGGRNSSADYILLVVPFIAFIFSVIPVIIQLMFNSKMKKKKGV